LVIKNGKDKFGKIVDKGLKITHLKKNEIKRKILSDEEISNICLVSRFTGVLTNVVEDLNVYFNDLFLTIKENGEYVPDVDLFDRLYGKDRRRQYVCSIYAGKSSVLTAFESLLRADQILVKKIPEDKIRRVGLYSFWHYFIECDRTSLSILKEGIMMFSREKVSDVVRENQPPSCSIASSFKQIKYKN